MSDPHFWGHADTKVIAVRIVDEFESVGDRDSCVFEIFPHRVNFSNHVLAKINAEYSCRHKKKEHTHKQDNN